MTVTAFDHVLPWTDEEYLALGETPDRVELFDGSLHVSPAPTNDHQDLSSFLWLAIMPAAKAAGLRVSQAVNVRLRRGRIPIPDLVVADASPTPNRVVIDAAAVHLVAEIVSPGNAAADRVTKMHYYAEAGIPWYLLVDQDPIMLRLFRLDGDKYLEHATATSGELLRLTDPILVDIDPIDLRW